VKFVIDNYSYAVCDGYPTDASDECVSLSSSGADADGFGLASDTRVTDLDVAIARGEIYSG